MPKRSPRTPRSKIRSALRQLWLRSRERAAALKVAGYACEQCGVKQSKAKGRVVKVEVHHLDENMYWDHIIEYIYRHLLVDPGRLEVLCPECHKKLHRGDKC